MRMKELTTWFSSWFPVRGFVGLVRKFSISFAFTPNLLSVLCCDLSLLSIFPLITLVATKYVNRNGKILAHKATNRLKLSSIDYSFKIFAHFGNDVVCRRANPIILIERPWRGRIVDCLARGGYRPASASHRECAVSISHRVSISNRYQIGISPRRSHGAPLEQHLCTQG